MQDPLDTEGATHAGFHQVNNQRSFPAVVYPKCGQVSAGASAAEAALWAKRPEARAFLEKNLELHGCVLFRGLRLHTPQQFHDFITSFEGLTFSEESPIGGGGPRNSVVGPVHTSTESPAEFRIPFHHELAYITQPPTKLFFWCEVAPQKDGETPILFSPRVVDRLCAERPEFVEKLRSRGVKYVRTLDAETGKYQRGWMESFRASTKEEAEKNATLCGTEKVEWLNGNRMRVTTGSFEAIRDDSRTGASTWFNAVCLLHPAAHGKESGNDGARDADRLWDVVYGDGTEIADADVIHARRVMDEEGTQFAWKVGDVLVVDNMLALHSRNSFSPPRRILVAMTM